MAIKMRSLSTKLLIAAALVIALMGVAATTTGHAHAAAASECTSGLNWRDVNHSSPTYHEAPFTIISYTQGLYDGSGNYCQQLRGKVLVSLFSGSGYLNLEFHGDNGVIQFNRGTVYGAGYNQYFYTNPGDACGYTYAYFSMPSGQYDYETTNHTCG